MHEIASASHGGERAIISEATKYLLGIGDEDESLTNRKVFFPEHQKMKQLERFGILSMCRPKVFAVDEVNTEEAFGHLLSPTTNDVATENIEDALLTANTRGAELVREYVSTRIVERNIPLLQ